MTFPPRTSENPSDMLFKLRDDVDLAFRDILDYCELILKLQEVENELSTGGPVQPIPRVSISKVS